MSELNQERWAVASERGAEKIGLSYDDAVRLAQQLASEKIRGLAIVTADAGQQLLQLAESKATTKAAS